MISAIDNIAHGDRYRLGDAARSERLYHRAGARLLGQDRSLGGAESDEIPHGIRYSLTLHDRHGRRILGYDNAHATKPAKKGFAGRRLEYDHRHRHAKDKGVPYTFESAYQLLADFFCEVDRVLKEMSE